MKPMGEAGISVQNSNLYIDFPNNFTRQHFFTQIDVVIIL